jgi:hypothetical protein
MTNQDFIWVASFDIGKKNFAFYIEEFDKNLLIDLPLIPKPKRYNPNGTPTVEFKKQLKNICSNGKTILFKNSDLTENCSPGKYLDPETYHNMVDLLDQYKEYWDQCDAFVIEEQMSFGNRRNTMALKLGQHCYSYFVFNYGRFKSIIEFKAYHKTQVLGCKKLEKKTKKGKISYKAIDKPARKKWSILKATEILEGRGDFETMSKLTTQKKKDDLADVVCQLEAFKFLAYVEKSI